MADTVTQIKSRLNLQDVIGGYLKLQKSGANFKARCPFHNEKTPSFHINVERQIWHCFGCNKGGDMISFLQEIEGIEFLEALRILAPRAGVPLERVDSRQGGERSRRAVLLKACSLANAFFIKQLWHSDAGKRALAYLRERGLTDETIKAWQVGWAPNDWQALNTFLQDQRVDRKDLLGAGLVSEKNGRLYDRFRGRIMFPICDHNSQAVGFTGRIFGRPEDQEAKYINTPQTQLYDKSRILFGLDKAKMAIRESDACVLVEGNTDAIMSWQAGVQNVVATSGTALTSDQLRLLGRYSANLDFCFDTDVAGAVATRRGIALAMAANMNVRIAALDDADCKDPADYVHKHGDKWKQVTERAKPAVQYYLDGALANYDSGSPKQKKALLASVGPFVNRLVSRVERTHWISQLATVLRASEADVQTDLAALKDDLATGLPSRDEQKDEVVPEKEQVPEPDPLEQALLSLLMKDLPGLHAELASLNRSWLSERLTKLADELSKVDPTSFSWDEFLKSHDDGTWHLEFAYVRAQEFGEDFNEAEAKHQWQLTLARLGQRHMQAKADQMELDIREAEGKKDSSRLTTLLGDFTRLKQDIARLFHS
jgi:DNA primase